MMPGMAYEEKQCELRPGDCLLLHSDGLAEAHSPAREMFGFPRVADLVGRAESGEALIDLCLSELDRFTGPHHQQEDDITLVTLSGRDLPSYAEVPVRNRPPGKHHRTASFTVRASQP